MEIVNQNANETQSAPNNKLILIAFTKYMQMSLEAEWTSYIEQFSAPVGFVRSVVAAIHRAESGKAVGEDEIFVESFTIEPQLVATVLVTLLLKYAEKTCWKTGKPVSWSRCTKWGTP